MGKKKKKTMEEELLPVARWLPRVMLIMLAVLALLTVVMNGVQPKIPATPVPSQSPAVAPVITQDPGPTPEQEQFIRERFLRDWERIRATYPIPDIRQRFDKLVRRVETKDIRLHVSPFYMPGQADAYAMADTQDGLKIMQFFAPAIMDLYRLISDQDTRDDIIIGVLLHEEFHLDHHIFAHPKEMMNKDVLVLEESEAWWWCVQTLYLPMRAAGRLQYLPERDSIRSALQAYRDSRGDSVSPAWLTFARNATGER